MKKLKGFYAGVNLGGWYSQCDYSPERLDGFITEEDFRRISGWGFDHVRIPVDYNLFQDGEGGFIEDGFGRVEKAIGYCRKYGLRMILDLHKTQGFSFDKGEAEFGFFENGRYQELFLSLWREFARRFSHNADMLAFELLNEVTEPCFMPKWNELASKAMGIIREYSDSILILVGGYWNNSPEAIPCIDVPTDESTVFTFHCYEPLMFTHQGAYWVEGMPLDYRMRYKSSFAEYRRAMEGIADWLIPELEGFEDGDVPDAGYFRSRFAEAVKTAGEKDVYLYCGEYGVIELATPEDTLLWYEDIHSVFSEYGIGHALWSYRGMDFDFVAPRMDEIRDEIIESSKR